jgi:hypothetical protein
MKKKLEPKSIEQLLAEADELVQQIESDAITEMKAEQRLQFEIHAQNLKKIKSDVHGEIEKKDTTEEISESSEGMHEAILDIVKAMKNFRSNLL